MATGQDGRRELLPTPAWGHASGLTTMAPRSEWSRIPAGLLPEVQQCVNRYSWAFDERQEPALRECFTEDAVWEASVMGKVRVGPFIGREEVLTWLTAFWPVQRDQRRHVFDTFVVDGVRGDVVTAFAYLQLFGSRKGESQFETAGFARFELRRVEDALAIQRFTAGYDSPFWPMPVEEMTPQLRKLFGILGEPAE